MSHSKNLSIQSVQSIIEPTTPPSLSKKSSSNTTNGHNFSYHLQVNNDITNTPEINSKFWENNSLKNPNLNNNNPKLINYLPNLFEKISLDKENTPDFPKSKSHIPTTKAANNNVHATASNGGSVTTTHIPPNGKVNKEYLASINKVPLSSLKPEILRLAKDQYGCRFLQKKIDENVIPNYQVRFANFEIIFQEIYPHLYELIIDPFGNYLIQKLIVYCDHASLNLILEILQFNLFQISINQHGTRAFQKIIENLTNTYQLNLLIKGLKPYVIELIKDLNGNHVVQKILNKYPPKDCQFIYDSIIDDLFVVATHKHGCCVLQKCLNHVTVSQLDQFSTIILKFDNFETLINDQFGNYVLQYLISINSWEINNKIFENFLKFGLNNLCNLKFSSNVIEKFLKNCFTNELSDPKFIDLKFELVYYILHNDLNKLINDPYGNYVIQTMIDILINPQVDYLHDGVLVYDKLAKLLPEGFPLGGLSNASLQIIIIKTWFANCKIVSSFGKRIQSKINIILNNHTMPNVSMMNAAPNYGNPSNHVFHQRKQSSLSSASSTPTSIQNMNSNGEFIIQDQRSAGLTMTPINNETRANSVPHIFNQYDTSGPVNLVQQRVNDFIINEHPFGYNNGNSFDYNMRVSPPNQVEYNRLSASQSHQHSHQFSLNSDMSIKSHRSQSSSGSLPGFSSGNHYIATNEGFVNGNIAMNARNVNGVNAPSQAQINPINNQYNGQYMNTPPFQGNQYTTPIGTMGPLSSTGEPAPTVNLQKPMDPVYYY